MELKDVLSYASDISIITLLITVLYGGSKKWWVWGWLYEEKAKQLDDAKEEIEKLLEARISKVNELEQEIKRLTERLSERYRAP